MLNILNNVWDKWFPKKKSKHTHTYPDPPTPWVRDNTKDLAVLCDIDGTLCFLNGRDPFDASEADLDLPNMPLIALLRTLQRASVELIFLTMRGEEFRYLTSNYLDRFGLSAEHLFMRPTNVTDRSADIKRKIFTTQIKDKFDIMLAFEDDDEVVDLWRKEFGLLCLQPNYGNLRGE